MPRFPEVLQFRVETGTAHALAELAKAEGRRAGEVLREVLAKRLAQGVQTDAAGHRQEAA